MLQERLAKLFESYDPAIQNIVAKVIELEKQHISRRKPRVHAEIDEIITQVAQAKSKSVSQNDEPSS